MEKIIRLKKQKIINVLRQAIEEDLGGYGDITSEYTIDPKSTSNAYIICKEGPGAVLSGIDVAAFVFKELDKDTSFVPLIDDGKEVKYQQKVAEVSGNTRSMLAAERTALNFLQHLSGIATLTARYSMLSSKYGVRIVDTRKTKPLLRTLEKYAVTCGGGYNHRFGLFDGILIKDNHIHASSSIAGAIERARKNAPHCYKIEVEVTGKQQLLDALAADADIIMLDNMDTDQLTSSIGLIRERAPSTLIEVSGNVSLENLEEICVTGPDIVSVGKITHSAKSIDFSLEFA